MRPRASHPTFPASGSRSRARAASRRPGFPCRGPGWRHDEGSCRAADTGLRARSAAVLRLRHQTELSRGRQETARLSRRRCGVRSKLRECDPLMWTTGGRVTVLAALCVVAVCAGASSVQASSGVRYGIQDDAWLQFGPGTLNQRLATFKRLGVPLVRFTLHWNEIAARRPNDAELASRSRVRLARAGPGARRAAPLRADAGAHPGRHAGVGERRTRRRTSRRRGPETSAASPQPPRGVTRGFATG